ncbi:hypothetical protein [uncultured Winogradskyella sp.]|uniref:hypothetical protein n=1 Tax=uncultured Winogradskyella sp. TaxID=395353 RepID=UPI002620A8C3|nr:hypothetical protein [uncultured Winogradskyella sp.]
MPGIAIPIHTISHKGVNIPISLSYNSGGVKVEDIASWVGLGWNLQAGGLVSRTINWLPDNHTTSGYMNTSFTLQDFANRTPSNGGPCCINGGRDEQLLSSNASGRDYEPDEFNYSIPGHSGKFFYDQNLNGFVEVPYSNNTIEMTQSAGRIVSFTITTPDGIRYHFGGTADRIEKVKGAKSMSHTLSGIVNSPASFTGSGTTPYNQAWMLHYIEFPTSTEQITFNYAIEDDVKTIIRQEEELALPLNGHPMEHNINYTERIFTQPRIQEIIFPTGRIEFQKGTTERADLDNSYPLEMIAVYDNNNQRTKAFELQQSQTQVDPTSVDYNISPFFDSPNTQAKHRLRLDGVALLDNNDQIEAQYTLEYNPLKLPHRYSRAIDYFGYFNGQSNVDLIPRAKHAPNYPSSYFGNADRSVQPAYTQAGSLTKITYPTGGYDEFIWENNTVSYFFEGSSTLYRDYLLQVQDVIQAGSTPFDPDPNITYSKTFTVDPDSDGTVTFDIDMIGCGPNISNCDYDIKIQDLVTLTFTNILQTDMELILVPGRSYKIIAESNSTTPFCDPIANPGCTNPPDFLTLEWYYYKDPTPGEYMHGGLRVAQIKTFNDASDTFPELNRSFDYTYHSGHATPDLVSGTTYRLPTNLVTTDYAGIISATTFLISSNARSVLNSGSFVGYKHITETLVDGANDNGRKEYVYSSFIDYIDTYQHDNTYGTSGFPQTQRKQIRPFWRIGNLKELSVFDTSNNLVKRETYQHETHGTLDRAGDAFAVHVYRMPDVTSWGNNHEVEYYGYTNEYHRLKSQTTTDYLNSGNVTVTQNYTYDNNALMASKTSVTNSNGHTQENHVTYVQDLSSPSAAEQLLINQNRYETVKTEAILKDGITTLSHNTTETVYHNWGNDQVLPQTVKTSKGSEPLRERLSFKAYDDDGNILQVAKTDGIDITYIYGYDNTLPVAKIENATYAQVSSYVANIQSKSDLDDDHCMDSASCDEKNLRTALNALRTALPNAMVTTYTYDPQIGITSMTDPKGYTVYYEYDDFNRLQRVKDQDGKVMSENKYNYHTSN